MCNLTRSMTAESFVGYKLVAEEIETGKNYSLAMGFCYDDYEEIPIVEEQKRLTTGFIDRILYSYFVYRMKGRTSVYKFHVDAKSHYLDMTNAYLISLGFELKVKKAKVSIHLMEGEYGGNEVVAGRKIEFLETIEIKKY